ncbi:MAG: DNA-binding transcriptional regulator [Bacteroidia bacterium]|nr:DNA-binding transcriptional regulator [Bacteroidia bacterium]
MIRLILLTDFTEAFPHNLLRGILEYSKNSEPWVVCRMPPSYKQSYGIKGVLKWAKRWEADAIIGQFHDDDEVELFCQHGIVALAQDFKSRFSVIPNITSEYKQTGRMAADFFLQKGFRNFAYYGYKHVVWSEERCKGFHERIQEEGVDCHFFDYQKQNLERLWYYRTEPLANWLRSLPLPIALMACDDTQANRIMEVCRIIGLKIPEEVAVLGVDNDEIMCTLSDPPLSSVNINIKKGGYEAAQLIERLIRDKEAPYEDIVIRPTGIVNRLSTDIYATEDKAILIALRYIHQNLNQKMSVDDIVGQVPLSRRLVEVRFKNVTGKSIYQYIFDLRMERFAQLLLESKEPVADIGMSVGLLDPKNLSRQFKQWKGCTPLEYRKRHELKK